MELAPWIGFTLFVIGMLALDLGIFHRKAHTVRFREAMVWVAIWVSLAMLFNVGVYYFRGRDLALQFLAGYLVEESLSVDNIFVFLLIFRYFRVPGQYQHRVLFWGILGAIVMRAIFIGVGITLIEQLHWIVYVFGAFLILTGIKMAVEKEQELHPERNIILRIARRLIPIKREYVGGEFFVQVEGRGYATPLFIVLLLVETSDIIFAVDSIPAVLAISREPFIVYTSNIFAILGLRSMYFALAGFMDMFRYLHYGLSAVLVFVGVKMLLGDTKYSIPITTSLLVIVSLLAIAIIASILIAWHEGKLHAVEEPVEPPTQEDLANKI